MPNSLSFTTVVSGKNVNAASVVKIHLDEDAGEGVVEVQLTGPGGVIWPVIFPLGIRNGSCDAAVPQTTPVLHTDIIKLERLSGGAGIATLFTDVLAAEAARNGETVAGQSMTNNRRSNILKVLQAAVGNRAAGSSPATATVLPAGTVS